MKIVADAADLLGRSLIGLRSNYHEVTIPDHAPPAASGRR